MSFDYPTYCPHCRANVEDCEAHHAGRAKYPGFGPGVCPLVQERDRLRSSVAALRAALERARELSDGLAAHFSENPESEWAMVMREEAEELADALAKTAAIATESETPQDH